MADFPDFTIPKWDERDWAARTGEYMTWTIYPGADIPPGYLSAGILHYVPEGIREYTTDVAASLQFTGRCELFYWLAPTLFYIYLNKNEAFEHHYGTPLTADYGNYTYLRVYNDDIVSGRYRVLHTALRIAASNPKKPKSDDPEERYRLGDYNFCDVILFEEDEALYIFNKRKEDKFNYLRLKNPFSPKQKKLASFHLKLNEAREVKDIIRDKPKKVKAVLKKYEEKYKHSPFKFFK